ncbi:MAG: Ig-like domain-containing protein, partial [Bacteroidota bacterium]|nr:Ig-like domain-containing protein [Bacteroidota bacterium]
MYYHSTCIIRFLFLSLLMLGGCAGQRPPEGGPVDITPPEIVSMYPAPNTVNYHENKIILEFSKYVERRSVEESIFISPNIGDLEFNWSGTEVEIVINEQLKKNTTYVFTLGTDVFDVNNRNRLAKAFSLAFSTGAKIDNGAIAGAVYNEKPEGIMIFSYRLNDIKADTLNPVTTKPDYITQTGKNGLFTLTNLAYGTYRLFAIRDDYKNLLYDPETDEAGTTEDVTLTQTDTVKAGIQFIVSKEDTTMPRISSVRSTDQRHVQVVFSEPLDSGTVRASAFTITDTTGMMKLPVKTFFPNDVEFTNFTVVTDSQKEQQEYVMHVENVKDRHGFIINPIAKQKLFKGSNRKDTLAPNLYFASIMRDSGSSIFSSDSVLFTFSDAVAQPVSDSIATVRKQNDSSKVKSELRWVNANVLMVKPSVPYQMNQKYMVWLRWNGMKDVAGNRCRDSLSVFKFSIIDPELFGSIEGSFAGFANSPVVIQTENIADKSQKPIKVKRTQFG